MNAEAGKFDRRIQVQVATETQDRAGTNIKTFADTFQRWAQKVDSRGREFFGASQVIRDSDTVFEVRSDSQTRTIAPESHRIVYQSRVFEVVAIAEGRERRDTIILLCAFRPDQRGAAGPINGA